MNKMKVRRRGIGKREEGKRGRKWKAWKRSMRRSEMNRMRVRTRTSKVRKEEVG